MNIHDFVIPLGLTTYSLLIITFLFGLFRWNFKYHRLLAIVTLIAASIHLIFVILSR
jgi:hypothetical protein